MLQAAAAAAQSERDEMRLYLETAIRMETLQRARDSPARLVSAGETRAICGFRSTGTRMRAARIRGAERRQAAPRASSPARPCGSA